MEHSGVIYSCILTLILIAASFIPVMDTTTGEHIEQGGLITGTRAPLYRETPAARGSFVRNMGQWDDKVLFRTSTSMGNCFICIDGLYMDILSPEGGCVLKYGYPIIERESIEAAGELPGTYNYFIGSGEGWVTGAKAYSEVRIDGLWPSIDARFYMQKGNLKYDLVCGEKSSIDDINFRLQGIRSLTSDERALRITLENGRVISDGGLRVFGGPDHGELDARYRLMDDHGFGFRIDDDIEGAITIDPIIYGTYVGGSSGEAMDSCLDEAGYDYVFGRAGSDLHTTPGAYHEERPGGLDCYVMKFNETELIYATYLGGDNIDHAHSMEVHEGCAILTGYTYSADFPVTPGCFNSTQKGYGDAYLTKLSPEGTQLLFSTLYGGSDNDHGRDILVSPSGDIVLYGGTSSPDLPMTNGSYCPDFHRVQDLFVAVFDGNASTLNYATYMGYTNADYPTSMDQTDQGILYLGGYTQSYKFPVEETQFDHTFADQMEGFVVRLDLSGPVHYRSTLVGGCSFDYVRSVAVAPDGDLIVGGETYSNDLWATEGAYQGSPGGGLDMFLLKLDENLTTARFSTYIGSNGNETMTDMVLDSRGRAHCLGEIDNSGLNETWGAVKGKLEGYTEGIYFIMNETGTGVPYLTYLGGFMTDHPRSLELGEGGIVHISGSTESDNFPPADVPGMDKEHSLGHGPDGFLVHLDRSLPPSPPRGLGARWSVGWINLTWKPPSRDNGYEVTEYLVEKNLGAGFFEVDTTTSTSTNITLLYSDGIGVIYRVSAKSAAGYSNHTEVMAIPPPSDLDADISFHHIDLLWDPVVHENLEVEGYSITRTSKRGPNVTLVLNSTTYRDINVTKGITYDYSVRTVVDGYMSAPSKIELEYVTVPGPPEDLTLSSENHTVHLNWSASEDDGGSRILGYHVYRGAGGHDETHLHTVVGDIRNHTDNSTLYGVNYSYRVSAINKAGSSVRSSPVSLKVVGMPEPPWNISVERMENSILLRWEPPLSDGGLNISAYKLYRSVDGGEWNLFIPLDPGRSNFTDGPVAVKTLYSYYITSVTDLGESEPSDTVSAILEAPPSAPRQFTLENSSGLVELEWLPPAYNGHSELLGYRLYKKVDQGPFELLEELDVGRTFYLDDRVEIGSAYTYRVKAYNAIGDSPWSPEKGFTYIVPPSVPKNLLARQVENEIDLTWFPSDDGGSPVVRYDIFRGLGPDGLSLFASVGGEADSYRDRDAEIAVRYYYQVSAYNGMFNSSRSQIASCMVRTVPGEVKDCSAVFVNGSVRISWSPPDRTGGSEILYYRIYKRSENFAFQMIDKVPGNETGSTDPDIPGPGLYVYYIGAENQLGCGPDSIKFDVEVPESAFREGSRGLAGSVIAALVFLAICLLVFALSLLVHIKRRHREDVPEPDMFPRAEFQGYVDPDQYEENGLQEGYGPWEASYGQIDDPRSDDPLTKDGSYSE